MVISKCESDVLLLLEPLSSYPSITHTYLPLEKALALDGFDFHVD
jgi:hypothetical protein